MIALRQAVKAKQLQAHLDRALLLLPVGGAIAAWTPEGIVAQSGTGADSLSPDALGVFSFSLQLERHEVGRLLVKADAEEQTVAPILDFLGNAVQSLAEAFLTRHAVSAEALESYREMAVLQRAIQNFNQTLKPEKVAKVLLQEIAGRTPKLDFGAVYRRNQEDGDYARLGTYGNEANDLFAQLEGPEFLTLLEAAPGILNNIESHTRWPLRHEGVGSLLLLPLIANDENLGTLVLGSSLDEAFASVDLKRAETLVSVASTAIRNAQLFAAQKTMFLSFVDVMSSAIDAASPFTAGHCQRVPDIVRLIAKAANETQEGPLAGFKLSEDEWDELNLAASLHDCGKVNTPSWLIDKSTKLETVMDRMELIQLRTELLKYHLLSRHYEARAAGMLPDAQELEIELAALDADVAFLKNCNIGKEFMSQEVIERIESLAAIRWTDAFGHARRLIKDSELDCLLIKRGTLTERERYVIEDHAKHTIRMLSKIPFPNELKNVAKYAGGHHERLDGKGYPLGLNASNLSMQARIIALADVFEALTAPDRPYRPPLSLSRALDILADMSRNGHIDPDLFELFVREEIYKEYALADLKPEQIDDVDIEKYLSPCLQPLS